MTSARFFRAAIFLPLILFPLAILDKWSNGTAGELFDFDLMAWRYFLYEIGFIFGVLPYVAFSIFMFRKIRTKTEKQIIRLMWWSPIWFIPFFGLAWFLLGLVVLLTGNLEGLGMMVGWVGLLLYIPLFGYFFVALVYAAFLFFRFMNWIKVEPQT